MIRDLAHRLSSRAALAVVLAGGLGVSAPMIFPGAAYAQAVRDAGAEQFVASQGQRVLSVLNDHTHSLTESKLIFRKVIDEVADVPLITSFVLGKYGRTITPAQREHFAIVFRQFAQNVYESRLTEYHGETLKITGSVVRKPGDVIVNSLVVGGQLSSPVPVAWRLRGANGAWKVVDIQVRGVWLAITQQQDFVSTIDNAGGNIDVLIAQLKSKVQADKAKAPR
jgi:phospholipid transport system substrate-binding protein